MFDPILLAVRNTPQILIVVIRFSFSFGQKIKTPHFVCVFYFFVSPRRTRREREKRETEEMRRISIPRSLQFPLLFCLIHLQFFSGPFLPSLFLFVCLHVYMNVWLFCFGWSISKFSNWAKHSSVWLLIRSCSRITNVRNLKGSLSFMLFQVRISQLELCKRLGGNFDSKLIFQKWEKIRSEFWGKCTKLVLRGIWIKHYSILFSFLI